MKTEGPFPELETLSGSDWLLLSRKKPGSG